MMHRCLPISRLQGVINSHEGLKHDEALLRLKQYGRNDITETSANPILIALHDTMRDPMLWFLLATSTLFLILGEFVEAAVLFAATFPLVGMDFYLHRRTQMSTQGLKTRLASTVSVLREGVTKNIRSAELVPGDLIVLSAGDNVPADGVLISANYSQFDESVITGESYPTRKQPIKTLDSNQTNILLDSVHWAYAGSRLLTGDASIRVIYTGNETLYGEIVTSVANSSHDRTHLQKTIAHLVGILIVAATSLCLMLALARLYQGFGYVDAILSALILGVAALPEEFPIVFTFFLGVGVYRLAQRGALVRRAVAVENIGRITYICSDKTGTLTEGKLKLVHCFPSNGISEQELLNIAANASRAETNDPLDLAILESVPTGNPNSCATATYPFTEDRKRETSVYKSSTEILVFTTKGAPETVFKMCNLTDQEQHYWHNKVIELAESGHKVIACAKTSINSSEWVGDEPSQNMLFFGILAFEDPVREGIADAIKECLLGHIHVIMITGDHQLTARAVANEIGLGGKHPKVIEASQLEEILRNDPAMIQKVDVIARAVPSQKLEIVNLLKSLGEIVAVTGDGVNDVPALQVADVGIAMGERGTRSAREAASVVLLDDNFRTIIQAILGGRQLFNNLQLSFAYLLIIHIPLVITAAIIPLFGYPLLYLPIHIVWLELIIHPTALLVFQNMPSHKRLSETQLFQTRRFFTTSQWLSIIGSGLAMTLILIAGYLYSLGIGYDVEHARAMAMMGLTASSASVTIVLSKLSSQTAQIVVSVTMLVSILIIQTPLLSEACHLTSLHLDDLLICLLAAFSIAVIVWLGKFNTNSNSSTN